MQTCYHCGEHRTGIRTPKTIGESKTKAIIQDGSTLSTALPHCLIMPAQMEREPDWDSFPPEMRKLMEQIRKHGTNSLNEMQKILVSQVFRTAAVSTDKRVLFVRNKIQEAHLDYCFRLPSIYRK